jgi:hypothetical protein
MLRVGICCTLIASDVHLQGSQEMDITGWEIRPAERMVNNHLAVVV